MSLLNFILTLGICFIVIIIRIIFKEFSKNFNMDHQTKKLFIIMFIVFSIAICLAVLFIKYVNIEKSKIESFVGKTIILGKDTLIVTDYNGSNETFNLSNRVIIDKNYVLKNAK